VFPGRRAWAARGRRENVANSAQADHWLADNGPKELESLLQTIVFQPSAPILVADNDRNCREASVGASALFGVPRREIVGRSLDDFAAASSKPAIKQLWQAFLDRGEQQGTLSVVNPAMGLREVDYIAKGNVLPERHLLVLRNKNAQGTSLERYETGVPSWVQDFALFSLDLGGHLVAWYSGAERIYGYSRDEAIGQHLSFLYPGEPALRIKLLEELKRAVEVGHFSDEGWHIRKDGSQFWANCITMALGHDAGNVRGFGRIVRDFNHRKQRDEELQFNRMRSGPILRKAATTGIVSGEFDQIQDVNSEFLEFVGCSREDLLAGRLNWSRVTPPQYSAFDDLAHEEGLRFGTCTPFEKKLIRRDRSSVRVLSVTTVLKISPFRWIKTIRLDDATDKLESVVESGFDEIVGSSAAMKRTRAQVAAVAPGDVNVLILGEAGTGKELVAHVIHKISPRRDLPFITLKCADLPIAVLERELFGYEQGAFAGALSRSIGQLEMAQGGALFLDEVGNVPMDLAAKLIRAVEEKLLERLGGSRTIPLDVRLLAATKMNPTQMVGDRLFRSDLYSRLKVFPIIMPPLRDHPEDIPVLAQHFMKRYAVKMDRTIDHIPADTVRVLVNWRWPGNVEELEKFVERSVRLSPGPTLHAPLSELRLGAGEGAISGTLAEVEREYILRIFRETGGVISITAARLGLPRTTLNAMMKKLGITRGDL
jgi:formate hydrogenlyase transcriptional activator